MSTDKPDTEAAETEPNTSAASSPQLEATNAAGEPIRAKPSVNDASTWTASDARGPLETAREGETPAEAAAAPTEPAEQTPDAPTTTYDPSESSGRVERPSRWPVAAALVIGAVVGAGSAALVYSNESGKTVEDPAVASLSARIDALEKRPAPMNADAQLKPMISDLDKRVGALESRPAGPTKAPDLGPLQQRLGALESEIDALKSADAQTKDLGAKLSALEGEVAAAKTASANDQQGIASIAEAQKQLQGKISTPGLAVVSDSLVQQIDRGRPYAVEVDALAALGADPAKIAVLRQNAATGVPSAKMLAAKFEPLADPITAAPRKAAPNASFVDKLKTGMFSMVSVRDVNDTSGTDLPSRVARIRADLAHDDIAGALETWNGLPDEAKAKSEAWGALAKTSVEAMNAARALQHDAVAALGSKKS